ncbi:MAG: sulfite exporter TauE/SafE family protein [Candidatus Rokubacteria bacterium]|nr:sulfite exporter TauE/SafE family protein [Candidatus Rokubacteria bacterium]
MSLTLAASAAIIALASFVMGLAGFGIALVALAFLPFVMSPVPAIVLVTLYALVFSVAMIVPLRREIEPVRLTQLLVGSIAGTPLGVWGLATLPLGVINRLIGVVLIVVVALEWWRVTPHRLTGPGWGLSAGALAGVMGGAIGTPGPPVILYAAAQGWGPRAMKANLLAFFIVNQAVILAGYWWAELLTRDVLSLSVVLAVPAVAGVAAGVALFNRIDAVRFRQIVFGVLLLSGVVLLARG